MPDFTRVIIIYNPNSTGKAHQRAQELQEQLARRRPKLKVKLQPTQYAGHAIELAYQAARKYTAPLIVSASGDGGYNEVINGAIRAQEEGEHPICAVLAAGNANDHARTMHQGPLADLIVSGKTRQLDLLKMEATFDEDTTEVRYAHSYVGLGLTPVMAVELNKHDLNSLKESWIVMRTFWGLKPVVIERHGKILEVDSLICSTIPQFAKLFTLSATSKPDDGVFEVTVLRHKKKRELLSRMVRGIYKDLGANSREKDYICTVLQAAPVQLDGEVMPLRKNTKLDISVCPGLLRTLI